MTVLAPPSRCGICGSTRIVDHPGHFYACLKCDRGACSRCQKPVKGRKATECEHCGWRVGVPFGEKK